MQSPDSLVPTSGTLLAGLRRCFPPLAHDLVEEDPGRHRSVQGIDGTDHRDGDEAVADLLQDRPKAFPLSTDDDADIPAEVLLVDLAPGRRIRSHDEDALLPDPSQGLCRVAHTDEGHPLGSPGGRLDRCRRQRAGPVFGKKDSLDPVDWSRGLGIGIGVGPSHVYDYNRKIAA